jgi:hypothetical protein
VLAREIASVALDNGGPAGTIAYCYPNTDSAMQAAVLPGAAYRAARWATFRIDTSTPQTPKLTVSYDRPGVPPTWHVLGPDIEDLQIALVLNSGIVCGTGGNSIDAPPLCDPLSVRAVRYTLVARSSSTVADFSLGRAGGFEDERPAPKTDGWLRRAVTSEIEVRNLLP